MKTYKFRPSSYPLKFRLKERRNKKTNYYSSFQIRVSYPFGTVSHRFLGKTHSVLHYYASHGPTQINKKYHYVAQKFERIHFGVNGTMRYSNKYSCDSWL